MDANVMVPIDGGDVKKLKAVLNEEDDMVTATSEKPSKEDHPPAGNINPLLLASARVGSWEALNVLLQREDEKKPPMMLPTQEFLQLLEGGSSDQGRAAARDVEDGGDLQHAASASVAAGALLKGVTPDGDTVLHAVAGNCWDGKDFLDYANIIHDRDRDLLFEKNHQGDTPLHCAARAGNSRMVSHLIELAARQGDDAKLKLSRMENKRQETALHEAVRFEDGTVLGRKEMEAFLSAAPDLPREDHAPEPEEWNIVKLLMDADPELANYPQDGVSPLCLAILLGKSTIALTLYDKSGENLSYSGPDGQNALHVAILRDTAMILYLVRWNKSLTTQLDKDGSTPLHFASSLFYPTDRPSILIPSAVQKGKKILIPRALQIVFEANRTALYQADNNGSFPIHVAASVGSKNAIRFFLSACPDSVGLRDAKKRTLLHVAVEKGRFLTALYVCQSSSLAWILNMQDDDGNTALHLAIQARNFMMFCALFWNRKVNLDILNNKGITPRDLSRSKLPRGMGHGMNSENKISAALWSVGAKQGSLRCDKTEEIYSRQVIPKDEDKESERLRNAAESLMVASVLITTMAFTATFALPGGYRADDHRYGGTPTLAGSYVFDAFVMGTTLAFICSSIATIGFALAAAPTISLFTRRINFVISVLFLLSSVTSLSMAFALGVYMVLSPVARNTAIAVCVISPAVLLSANVELVINLTLFALALCNRIGPFKGMDKLLSMYGYLVVVSLWPFVVTFGWAAFARIHRHG